MTDCMKAGSNGVVGGVILVFMSYCILFMLSFLNHGYPEHYSTSELSTIPVLGPSATHLVPKATMVFLIFVLMLVVMLIRVHILEFLAIDKMIVRGWIIFVAVGYDITRLIDIIVLI